MADGGFAMAAEFSESGWDEMPPDHSTISCTWRLIDRETHQAVFGWVLDLFAEKGLPKGKTVGIDGTTLEANQPCVRSCAVIAGKAKSSF